VIDGDTTGPALDLIEDRLNRLRELAVEEGTTVDERAFEHMRAFLAQAGVTTRPAVFLKDDGTPRIMWSTPTGDPDSLQFAASFLPDGQVQVVRSHGPAVPLRTRGRLVGGGLVAETILGRRLIDVLRSSGLEPWIRGGPRPRW
jgi:hypothetical protein